MSASRTFAPTSIAAAVAAILAAAATAPAHAAAPATEQVLEEVVVTVERVEQSLQSYAGTAAAVSQAELDAVGVTNLVSLPAVVPGLEIANYEGNTEIYVRGIGSNANTELGDPAIAPHLDDVYIARPRGLGVAFFDLERVEVNVGPQGTVRGRNALGGSVNIVTRKPKLDEFSGYGEYAVGNYNLNELRGALNVPLGEIAAGRVAVYSSKHDDYVRNTGPLNNLKGWESGDDFGARAHFLLQPSDRFSLLLSGDYLNSKGTGSRGVNFFNASRAGKTVDDFSDPRRVNMIGFSPVQDTHNWGVALNTTFRTDFVDVQYIGGYRKLHYTNSLSTGGRNLDFPGDEQGVLNINSSIVDPNGPRAAEFIAERYYGDYSALIWDANSMTHTHELRFTSPNPNSRFTWAVGLYKFKENQEVFLGIPLDFNAGLPYLEFNQGSVTGESKSAYADLTFAVTDKLKLTAGARYSDESKERTGFNFIGGLDTGGVSIRTGTPGFRMTGLSRTLTNPDADGDGVANTVQDLVALFRAGVASYGINDTLESFLNGQCVQGSTFGATCASYPGLVKGFGGGTEQFGKNSDQFVDWRFRASYDLTDDNLLYLLVATGNKAPSFNDTIDLGGGVLFTPPVGPEKNTMYEIGSKNTFDAGGNTLTLNGSVYYLKYTDQVFSTLAGLQLLDNDPTNDIGCQDSDPNTQCSAVTLNQNIGESKNVGVQIDAAYSFRSSGVTVGGTFLWQDTEYKKGSIVTDNRRANPNGGTLQVDLGGDELPRTPPITINLRVGQDIQVPTGTADWVVAATYRSRQYLTAFNSGPGKNGARLVTATDANGVATAYGNTDLLELFDKVDSYVHFDLGVGYTHAGGNVRVEGFVNNVTNEDHQTQEVFDTNTQEFVFNPPRTYGVRMRVSF